MKINLITAMVFVIASAFSSLAITDSIPSNRLTAGLYGCYGFSGYHAYGAGVDVTNAWRIWNHKLTSGTFDVGFIAGYQREPFSQANSILNGAKALGAGHRIEGLLTIGTTVSIPPSRRILCGMGVFGGWSHIIMRGYFSNSRYNISGDYRADKGVWASGFNAHFGVRATDRISIVGRTLVPLPYAPAPVTSYLIAFLGVTIDIHQWTVGGRK
jgi:hypothetical protein